MQLRIAIAGLILLRMALPFAPGITPTTPPQDTSHAALQKDPAKLRARDSHQDLLVAADPLTSLEDYKGRFPKRSPFEAGVVAIDIYFRNDGALPVRINLSTICLTLSFRGQADQNIPSLRPEQVADYILNKRVGARRAVGSNSKPMLELVAELRAAQLSSDIAPPHGVMHGLLYFDIGGHYDWITFARLYIPDLKQMGSDKTMFFFDVPLGSVPAP